MAKNTVVLNTECELTVTEVEYVDKTTKEPRTFNAYSINVNGNDFRIQLAPADKKLFEYILGIN